MTLALAPWLLMVASLLFLVRRRPRLQDYPPTRGEGAPRVSIVVPTRNDANQVGLCLATLLGFDYPDYEVIVVDHGSQDGTREIVEALRRRTRAGLRLVEMGGGADAGPDQRPWRARACGVGAGEATGELLLFTEPGTVHDADLLGRAVAAMGAEGADLLTVQPRLTMHGFWERLVMPHVWLALRARFPSARLVNRSQSPRNAVAHHQFLLFRREAYERIGGHDVVGPESVEDLAVAQAVSAAGLRVFLVHGDAFLEARMFRSFSDIASDRTLAFPSASRTTLPPWARIFVPWLIALAPILFFVLPPVLLVAGLLNDGWGSLAVWGFRASALALIFWLVIYAVHRIRPAYAMIYPAGALATAALFLRGLLTPNEALD